MEPIVWGGIIGMLAYIPAYEIYDRWKLRRSRMQRLSPEWIYNRLNSR